MDGVLNIYKPPHITSHKTVQKVKAILKAKKAGHAGTLDPFAEGVLLVCLNKATRIAEYLTALPKEYVVEMTLGIKTDTYDLTGEILLERDYSYVTKERVEVLLRDFLGEYQQLPPMYSAKKREGVPLYKYARKGIVLSREPQKVFIYGIKMLDFDPPSVTLNIRCSRGTYIRTLVDDIGERLSCGATVKSLKRTAIGNFKIEESVTLDMLSHGEYEIYSIDDALYFLPEFRLNERELFLTLHGTGFRVERDIQKNTPIKLKSGNSVVAIAVIVDGDVLRIKKVLREGMKQGFNKPLK